MKNKPTLPKPEDRSDVKEINIEICINCNQHQGHTRHNESTYLKYFNSCKSAIEALLPELTVIKNGNLKPGWKPQLGAFEISCNGILIYSKIRTGLWPQANLVASRVKNFVEDYKAGKSVTHYVEIKERKVQEEKKVITPNTVYGNFYSPTGNNNQKQNQQEKQLLYEEQDQNQQPQEFQQEYLFQQEQNNPQPKQDNFEQQQAQESEPQSQKKIEQPQQQIEEKPIVESEKKEEISQDNKDQQQQEKVQKQDEEIVQEQVQVENQQKEQQQQDKPIENEQQQQPQQQEEQ